MTLRTVAGLAVRRRISRRPDALGLVALVALALVVLAYAGLIARSRWQADEYIYVAFLREFGWRFELDRFLHWGPRPWSEPLFVLYGLAVDHWHRPLSARLEAVLWTLLGLACLLPAYAGAGGPGERLPRLLLGMAMLACCFVGHPVAEVMFWPAGSLAYVPTLAALCWLFWSLLDGSRGRPRRFSAAAALVLAAGCSEVGLFLAACLVPVAAILGRRQPPSGLWWLLPSLAVIVPVAYLLAHGRLGTSREAPSAGTAHHVAASLGSAILPFVRDLVAGNPDGMGVRSVITTLASRSLLALGARFCAGQIEMPPLPSRVFLLGFSLALALAAFGTLASAFYQFGALCCQRHETMREDYLALAAISLGAWSASAGRLGWPRPLAPLVMVAAVLPLFAGDVPGLVAAYRNYPAALRARAVTWQSGFRRSSSAMVLVRGPDDPVVSFGDSNTPGTHVLGKDTPWYDLGVMKFFGKTSLTVLPSP